MTYASEDMLADDSDVGLEMLRRCRLAEERWGTFRSTHEVYGVLAEEFAEMLDAIHADDMTQAQLEAIDIAAVAYRFARDGIERDPS